MIVKADCKTENSQSAIIYLFPRSGEVCDRGQSGLADLHGIPLHHGRSLLRIQNPGEVLPRQSGYLGKNI